MIALDTNVVVRLLVADDAAQARRARRLLEAGEVLVVPTVLLETEWVLRGAYGMKRSDIAAVLRGLLGLPSVVVSCADEVACALDWFERGVDFADALHLALAAEAAAFATFDECLVRRRAPLTGRRLKVP